MQRFASDLFERLLTFYLLDMGIPVEIHADRIGAIGSQRAYLGCRSMGQHSVSV